MELETLLDRPDVPTDVKEVIKRYLAEQKEIKTSQEEIGLHLRQTLDSMGDAIHVVGSDLRFILFNSTFKQWNKELGLKEDVIGQKITEVFPFLSDRIIDEYNQVFSTGKPLITEEHTKIRDDEFIIETRKIPIIVEGTVSRVVTVIKNVTESKKAMIKLQESEEKYRNLVERANDGIAIVQDSLIKYINPSLARITGYTAEELYNTPIMNYIHPDLVHEVINRYEGRMAGESVSPIYETKLVLKNDRLLEIEVNAGIINYQGKPADLAIIRDISERKQVEQVLRESEEKYRTILENIEDGYYEVNLAGEFIFFNDSLCTIFGYARQEIMNSSYKRFCDEQTATVVFKTFNAVYNSQEPKRGFNWEIIRKDGKKRNIEASVSLLVDSSGKILGFRGIVRDITERIQAEQALRESEERYRRLIELSPDAITLTDLNFNIIAVNKQAIKVSGANIAEELIGKNAVDLIAPEDQEIAIAYAQKTLQGETVSNIEYRLMRLDGTFYPAELSAAMITDVNGDPFAFISIVRDITERKIADMEIRAKSNAIDSSISAINISDLDGRLTYVNSSFLDMYGFEDKSEVLGKPMTDFTSKSEIFFDTREILLREGSWMGDLLAKKRDGTLFPIEISISLIKSESGEPHSFFASMIDITDRKMVEEALKESEQKFRVISERTLIGIGILQDDVLKYANQALADIFEYSIEEILNWEPGESAKVIYPEDKMFVMEQGRKKQLGDKDIVTNYSYRLITKSNKVKWVDNYSKSIIYMGETANLVTLIDITERKQAELALRESKEKYKMLVEKLQEGVLLEDVEGKISFLNPRTAELIGYTEEELLGKHWSYIVPEEYGNKIKEETAKRPKGISSTYEAGLRAKDGHEIPVIITAAPIYSVTGKFDGVLTVFTDITERKLYEKQLEESAEKYRTILETIEEGYYEVDIAGNFTFFNDSICNILGYSRTELLGMNYRNYMDEETAKKVYRTYNTVYRTGEPTKVLDFGFIRKNGVKGISESSVSPIRNPAGKIIGFRGIVRDVTERIEMEKALGEEREKYQKLIEKLEEGLTVEDPDGFITFVNPKTLETLGYTEEELIGKHWSFIVPENDLEASRFETAKRPKGVSGTYESNVIAKDGTIIPVIVSAAPIFSITGEFQGVLVLSTDITEQKRVERELQQSEEKYSDLFHYSNDSIFLHDLEGNIIDVNKKTLELFGYSKPEILLINISELHPFGMLTTSKEAFETVSKEGYVNFEIEFKKKTGEVFPAEVSSSLFEISGKPVIQGIVRDITERKRAEKALLQVKLEEERYHAMLSHFINNDMQKIINNLELLTLMYESKLELDDNIVNDAINIASGSSKTIDRVNKIFGVLQSPFFRPEESSSLLDIINKNISELSEYPQTINIENETLEIQVSCDDKLNDVFKELFLFILTSKGISKETSVEVTGSFLPSSFCVLISDCCSEPLSEETVSKLSGKITDEWEIIGHNIGIALASVIMQHYGGSIKIRSLDPKGNEFQLLLPLDLIKAPNEIQVE
ncbi:MAG: PAS domain S-box protein [Candidatus Heimdallarchaeota archaeon]|nr:MAG: PAS domain S-box protein [Candidatus Heimdallarchaeota archaeon]